MFINQHLLEFFILYSFNKKQVKLTNFLRNYPKITTIFFDKNRKEINYIDTHK